MSSRESLKYLENENFSETKLMEFYLAVSLPLKNKCIKSKMEIVKTTLNK